MDIELSKQDIELLLEQKDSLTPELLHLIEEYQRLKQPFPIGEKCAIPFAWKHDLVLLPAIVADYPSTQDISVMLLTPITPETVPCESYLAGQCQEPCKFHRSHGYVLPAEYTVSYEVLELDSLADQLQNGTHVWYKKKDNGEVWKEAQVIQSMSDSSWRVMNDTGKPYLVELGNIMPIKNLNEKEDKEDEEVENDEEIKNNEEIEKAPNSWGAWQAHTTGFAAKMMKKMGYKEGKGLGIDEQGRVDFVQETAYAQDRRLGLGHTAEKKKNKRKKKAPEEKKEEKEEDTIFGYVNSILAQEKSQQEGAAPKPTSIREAYGVIAKLQSELDKALANWNHARTAYMRNKGTASEGQFLEKFKNAANRAKSLQREMDDLQRYVKQTKEKQDMYKF